MPIVVVCPGCRKNINAPEKYAGQTKKCPGCGAPFVIPAIIVAAVPVATLTTATIAAMPQPSKLKMPDGPRGGENILITAHPKMFRNRPIVFAFCAALVAAFGLGLLPLAFWWLKCHSTTLTVSNKRTVLRRGLISKHTREVRHSDVRFLELDQSVLQRLLGVGSISISSAAQGEVEIVIDGIAKPQHIKETIDGYRP
jgi:membrane protein YdbS with pleckstrin-like domain